MHAARRLLAKVLQRFPDMEGILFDQEVRQAHQDTYASTRLPLL